MKVTVRAWLDDPNVQAWLTNIGAGAIVAQFVPGLPLWLRFFLGAITLVCWVISFPRIWSAVQNVVVSLVAFLKNFWQFLTILAAIIGVVLFIWPRRDLPREIREVRRAVIEIQQSLSEVDVIKWWAATDQYEEPAKTFFVKGEYELIVVENLGVQGQILRTYIVDGRRIASDVLGPEPYAFAREYYRPDGCNFATEYFDTSGRYIFLEYDKHCAGSPEIFDLSSPVFSPPVPLLTYR